VLQFFTGNRKSRWHAREYSEQANEVILRLLPLEPWATCKARWVWAGAVIFALATCSLQFAKVSAATLLQQEKNNSENLQRGRVHISGFICTVVSESSRRRTFGEFENSWQNMTYITREQTPTHTTHTARNTRE
jgi:hypothetical protein